MRRITKKFLILFTGVLFTFVYCEFVIYYVVISQCTWKSLAFENDLKALIISDTHLLGPRKGHWLDKWRREWQMYQAFQAILALHKPEVVFVLGDLFDEGEWSSDEQFNRYVRRFSSLFAVPEDTSMYVVAGNHDIGFHDNIRLNSPERFAKLLNSPPVQLLNLKGNHFVLINSMGMEGDRCRLCTKTRTDIQNISKEIKDNDTKPILMQHFPLFRLSDAMCTEPDSPPFAEKNKPFRLRIDALSEEATDYIVSKIKPRVVFGGHTHHGCLILHSYPEINYGFEEYSVPSFSWRNRADPKFILATFSPRDYTANKCGLPKETTIAIAAIIILLTTGIIATKKKTLGKF